MPTSRNVIIAHKERGKAAIKKFFAAAGNPLYAENTFAAVDYSGNGEGGVVEWTWGARHLAGRILGVPAKGKETGARGASVLTFKNGKIATQRDYWDAAAVLRQLRSDQIAVKEGPSEPQGAQFVAERAGAYWLLDKIALHGSPGDRPRGFPGLEAQRPSESDCHSHNGQRRQRYPENRRTPVHGLPSFGNHALGSSQRGQRLHHHAAGGILRPKP